MKTIAQILTEHIDSLNSNDKRILTISSLDKFFGFIAKSIIFCDKIDDKESIRFINPSTLFLERIESTDYIVLPFSDNSYILLTEIHKDTNRPLDIYSMSWFENINNSDRFRNFILMI